MFLKRSSQSRKVLSLLIAFLVSLVPMSLTFPVVVQATTTTLVTYPAPSGVTLNTTYTVQVRANGGAWQNLDVYQTTVGGYAPTSSSFTYFDCNGPVDVAVTYNSGSITSAAIRPTNNNIIPTINGNTMTFTISGPMKLSLEVNGDINHNLHIFANPTEVNPPSPSDPNVIYLAPGVYNQDYNVPSGKTLYIAGGAVVRGAVNLDNATNAKVIGRGVLDHPSGRALSVDNSSGITIDGIIVNDYGHGDNGGCLVNVGNSTNVSINNLKGFSYQKWTDGIDVFCSTNTTINDCLIRSGDDAIAIYGSRPNGGHIYWGDNQNVNVSNCILMEDVAHPIFIGFHGDPSAPGGGNYVGGINISNIDVILRDTTSPPLPMMINCGDGNLVQNVNFTDIRIDDICTGRVFDIGTIYGGWNIGPGRGIKNVYLKNVTFNGTHNGSNIYGYDSTRMTQDITFENLKINGNVILNPAAGNINIGNYTKNIQFIASGTQIASPTPFAPPTPINLALNKTASADSTQSGNPVSRGNDGSTGTRWCANDGNTGHWWTVDLGSSMNITGGSQVMWEQSGKVYQYKIETSNDNTNWTLKVDKTANTSTDQTQSDNFFDTARYVKITVTGLQSGCWASFYEFKVFGDPCNLALNKNAIADSSDPANPASNGSDGNNTTLWSANDVNNGHWWTVDLGANKNITYGTQVMWQQSGAYQYKVETSADNTNWTLKVDKTANTSTDQVQTDYFTGNARYVRITVTGLPSGAKGSFSDFKVLGDPTDLALNKNASADSSLSGSPASGANDGNIATHWTANDGNNGHWWMVDLGSNMNITGGTQVMWATGGVIYNYKIDVSTDNVNWTTKIDMTGNNNSAQTQRDYFVTTARYVRLTATGLPSGASASLCDFKVFGDAKIWEVVSQSSVVNLTSNFNADSFSYDTNRANGNFDGSGYTYSADLANSTPTFNGIPFQLGAMSDGSKNTINCTGQTITLPQGNYTNMWLLGAASGGNTTGTFQINYTDGTNSTAAITLADWCGGTANTVETFAHRHSPSGDDLVHSVNICAYSLTPIAGKTVASLQLPNNTSMHIFAITSVVTSPVSTVDLTSSFNGDSFSYDNNRADGNFDGSGYTYSAELLNTEPIFNGLPFQFGAISDGSKNTINCAGQTITLPQGKYSNIWFLGAGSQGNQTGTFQINYTDGTNSTASITEVDWCGSNSNVVETFAHRHSASGDDLAHSVNICAYSVTPTAGKTVASITLPNNSNMHVFAMTVVP